MKRTLAVLLLSIVFGHVHAQEIAIIGSKSLEATEDGVSLLALQDLAVGETYYFTENEYNNTTNRFDDAAESVVRITITSAIGKGNVIYFKENTPSSSNTFTASVSAGSGSVSVQHIAGSGPFSIASNGEALYVYTDSDADPTNGVTEIHAAFFPGSSSYAPTNLTGGPIPSALDPTPDFPNAILVDDFPQFSYNNEPYFSGGVNRVEYNTSAADRTNVNKDKLEEAANYIFAGTNTDLSTTAFTNFNLDATPPSVAITTAGSTASSVDFAVTFSETVSGVDLSDFTLETSTAVTASLAGISGSGANYTVTVNNLTGHGTVNIALKASGTGIQDMAGNAFSGGYTALPHPVGDAYDVSKAIYAGDEDRASHFENSTRSLTFNDDGTKMFILGPADRILEYSLSTAYDISTATYAGNDERFSVAAQETQSQSMVFNNDGTKMFVMGDAGKDINEYTLSTAYDVSTAVFAGNAERFSISNQEQSPTCLAFNNEGTKMYVTGSDGRDINEYSLATAFDVSTAAFAGNAERFSVAGQEAFPQSLVFNSEGTKMFVLGSASDRINEYHLSIAYDVSTAVFAGNGERLRVSGQEAIPVSMAFDKAGTKVFVLGRDTRRINEYSLAGPVIWDALSNQLVDEDATLSPFAAIEVLDPNGDNLSATITLDDNAKGTLSGAGLSGSGPYTLTATDAASLQTTLRALVFNPADNRVAVGNTETTTFTIMVSDGPFSVTDSHTTVVSNAVLEFLADISNTTHVSCTGGTDGSLTAGVTNGTPNYSYQWSNGASIDDSSSDGNTISGLAAGTYTVTVTDKNGSTATASGTITEPASLTGGTVQ